jgi:hypothetical protein
VEDDAVARSYGLQYCTEWFCEFFLNEVLDHLVYVSHCQKERRDSSVQAFRDQRLTLIKETLVGLDCTDSKRKMSH